MTNRPDGILYTGVTSDIRARAWQHREGVVEGFTKRHDLQRLVYAEQHDDVRDAIQREKVLKHWTRARKARLIFGANPEWEDLYNSIA